MSTDADPIAGSWYEHLQNGRTFEVVDVDDENGLVEIQYFDGDVDEIELDAWYELDLEPIEPPEDWSGPSTASSPTIAAIPRPNGRICGVPGTAR